MGRRHISEVKRANISRSQSKVKNKLEKRRKSRILKRYGKEKPNTEDRPPITYYDHKRLKEKKKLEGIQAAMARKETSRKKEEEKIAKRNKKFDQFYQRPDTGAEVIDSGDLAAMIDQEDYECMQNYGMDGANTVEDMRADLVEKAQKFLQGGGGEEEEEEAEADDKKSEDGGSDSEEIFETPKPTMLPIKIGDQVIQYKEEKEEAEASDSGIEHDTEEAPLKPLAVVDILAERKRKIHEKKIFIACASTKIISNPFKHMSALTSLVALLYEKDPDIALTVRKMAALSLAVIFHNVIPNYKLNTMDRPGIKLKKETRTLSVQENLLLVRYKYYLRGLEAMVRNAKYHKFAPAHLRMARVSLECFCELIVKHPTFNFSENIIILLVPFLAHNKDELREVVKKAFETMLYEDETGLLSLRLMKHISQYVRKEDFKVHSDMFRVLLQLRVTQATPLDVLLEKRVETAREAVKTKENLKKVASKHVVKLTIPEKKRQKKIAKLEHKLKATKLEQNKAKHESIQTEILHILFGLLVHVLKNDGVNKQLLGVTLEAFAAFGHLINVDYFTDLVNNLERILKTRELSVRERVHCVQTVFRLLTGLGSALHNDPSNFCDKLYELLMLLPSPEAREEAILPTLRTLVLIFVGCKKRITGKMAMGFVKRLSTVALAMEHSCNIPLLMTVRSIMLNHRATECLLDTQQEGGWGVYCPTLDHPIHCNAAMATLWEMHLLARGYHSMTRQLASHLFRGAPLLGNGSLPASFTKMNVEEVYDMYDSRKMELQPHLMTPDQHCGAFKSKWNKEKRKQILSHRLTGALKKACAREERTLECLIKGALIQSRAVSEDMEVEDAQDSDDDNVLLEDDMDGQDHEDEGEDPQQQTISADGIEEDTADGDEDMEVIDDAVDGLDFYPSHLSLLDEPKHTPDKCEDEEQDYSRFNLLDLLQIVGVQFYYLIQVKKPGKVAVMGDSAGDLRVDSLNSVAVPDPKNMQELIQYVTTLLQQMQDRFQTMSDQIINRNILYCTVSQLTWSLPHKQGKLETCVRIVTLEAKHSEQ
ncbi:Heat shock factor binding 1 [Trinorchestia longiramus]|nr:Heat shock factor binding 1 [Trinorchestia longiramus]